jgi:thioredoxin-related protein
MISGIGAIGLAGAMPSLTRAASTNSHIEIGGHMPEPWFAHSTLDLSKDLQAASAVGKLLALQWEQEGCQYCDELHSNNLQQPEIIDVGMKNFHVIQMDLWGEREFIDFDGEQRAENSLAKKHQVRSTPVIQFIKANANEADGAEEVFRIPGYAPPPLFLAVYEYVAQGGYETASLEEWIKSTYSQNQDQ